MRRGLTWGALLALVLAAGVLAQPSATFPPGIFSWIFIGDASGPTIKRGSGAPTASEPTGSLFLRTDNGTLYQRGTSSWAQVGSGGGGGGDGTCQEGEHDTGHSGDTLTIDWDDGAQQIVDLDDDLDTLTLSNGVDGCTYRILFVQDGSGGHTVTWPAGVEFEDDTAPTFDTTADNVTFCSLVKTAVGTGGYLGFCTTDPIAQP